MKKFLPGKPDPAPEKDRAKRKRERIAIGIVAVLVAGLTILEARLGAIGGKVGFTSNIIIFALININIILIVLLIFLVTRNVFKLILDRKRNILGAKIRSRLVLIFISFSLLPTIILFIAATNITTTSIKSWIGGRVGVALTSALDIARGSLEREAGNLSVVADRAATAVLRKGKTVSLRDSLDAARRGLPSDVSLLLVGQTGHAEVSGGVRGEIAEEIGSRLKGEEGTIRGQDVTTIVGESYASAVRHLPDGRAVVAVKTIPPREAKRIREIAKTYDEYHQVRLLDDPIRASYIATLILITLLVVFAASWMGIYLARQITVPVQMLAEGTQKVASGNLAVRLDYRSDDEFGHLVGSFNRMTADLMEMKKSLEDANVSLSATFEELRRRSRFIETILTNISTGVIVIDRGGRIVMINKVAERMLAIKTDKVLGKPYKEVVREEHYDVVRTLSREVGEMPGKQVERQVDLTIGAKRISLRVSVTALQGDDEEYMGLVVAFDDLSQVMRLQRIMAWREVARRIAHEIRNPLTPIQLSTERLQKKFAASHEDDSAFSECTQTILSEVGSLKSLVEEFTRFARMPVPAFKEGNLGEELRAVVETFRTAHPGITWEFEEGEVPPVWFDPFQIRRAVTNLLENAAAALGKQGRCVVQVGHEPARGSVRVSVGDDGPGVPPGDRDRLFEPYFSRKEGGMGLGLAIVSAIASDHQGTVKVRDNVPKGTVFEIEFPVRPKREG